MQCDYTVEGFEKRVTKILRKCNTDRPYFTQYFAYFLFEGGN